MDKNNIFKNLTLKMTKKKFFEKYLKLKGIYLHKQIYEILLEINQENVQYSDLSSIIRYDKNLRDLLYIYFATTKEYLRSILFAKFDLPDDCPFKNNKKFLLDNLKPKSDF